MAKIVEEGGSSYADLSRLIEELKKFRRLNAFFKMGSEAEDLHVVFFPFMAQGHLIPMIDMAKVFFHRGVKVTVVTTRLNATRIQKTIDRTRHSGRRINTRILEFPHSIPGLRDGCENLDSVASLDEAAAFVKGLEILSHSLEQILLQDLPHCIVSDMFMPWTVDVANKIGIPRLVFNGSSFFFMCINANVARFSPQETVVSDLERFIVPGLPDPIELTRSQLPTFMNSDDPLKEIMSKGQEADLKSYGYVMNSFYELEPAYVEHFRKETGKKVWHVGPFSVCNREKEDKMERGNKACIDTDECLSWLGSKEPGSVLYICFGSMGRFGRAQMKEISLALEESDRPFIWVVKDGRLPDGFEERTRVNGLIIKGWAPQVLILDHPSVGAFVTHCGWNSLLEGVAAGVPMITWPLFADQFFNEKLITQVLRTGVRVGSKFCTSFEPESEEVEEEEENERIVKREEIKRAVEKVMGGGDECEERRKRCRRIGEMANRAVEEGGSSYEDLSHLIEELKKIPPLK